jgi:homospermidine synthase
MEFSHYNLHFLYRLIFFFTILNMTTFNTIILIGCGAVAKTTLLYWDFIVPHITFTNMIIIEPLDINIPLRSNMSHLKLGLTSDNYRQILDQVYFDFVIDLSINVDSISIINYCNDHNIQYLSTAMEPWETAPIWSLGRDMYRHSLLVDQRTALLNNERVNRPTILIDHGMNPGLVSHFTKWAIEQMAEEEGIIYNSHAEAAAKLDICTIQCSEVDSQITVLSPDYHTFINTWSAPGFIEEAMMPVQIGKGSHEDYIPKAIIDDEQYFIPCRGMNMSAQGYNPLSGPYLGKIIPHGEAASIPRYLTYGEYRPSCYYVYMPSVVAEESLNYLRGRNYQKQENFHVLTSDEIISGYDAVGSLLIRGDGRCYWSGTIVSVQDVEPKFRSWINPTCLQVACGVLSGIDYIASHRDMGVIFPEQVDTSRVFELCEPFLGRIIGEYVDFRLPTKFVDLI